MLLSKLCERPFAFAELATPCCAGHEDLFLLALAETVCLTHEEEQEDYGDGSDAAKDEKGARRRPIHQRLSRETFHRLPEVQREDAH